MPTNDTGLERARRVATRIANKAPRRLVEDLREYAADELRNVTWTPEMAAAMTALADMVDAAIIDRTA